MNPCRMPRSERRPGRAAMSRQPMPSEALRNAGRGVLDLLFTGARTIQAYGVPVSGPGIVPPVIFAAGVASPLLIDPAARTSRVQPMPGLI